jgi:hypothetical protein
LFSISKLIVANSLLVEADAITSYGKSTSNSAKSVPGIVNNLAISLLLCWNLTSSKALHVVSDDNLDQPLLSSAGVSYFRLVVGGICPLLPCELWRDASALSLAH